VSEEVLRRAKVVKCEHGFIHTAHVYEIGNPKSEADAAHWVSNGKPLRDTDTYQDMEVEEVRPLLFGCEVKGCK